VQAEDIVRFTEMSGDENPLHYDAAIAKASRFGEIVVQGGVTSAILNAELAPGARVVSHEFGMGRWAPDVTLNVNGRRVLVWTIPIE
jgi:acyl dehydratase